MNIEARNETIFAEVERLRAENATLRRLLALATGDLLVNIVSASPQDQERSVALARAIAADQPLDAYGRRT